MFADLATQVRVALDLGVPYGAPEIREKVTAASKKNLGPGHWVLGAAFREESKMKIWICSPVTGRLNSIATAIQMQKEIPSGRWLRPSSGTARVPTVNSADTASTSRRHWASPWLAIRATNGSRN